MPSCRLENFDVLTTSLRLVGFEVYSFVLKFWDASRLDEDQKAKLHTAVTGVDVVLTDPFATMLLEPFKEWTKSAGVEVLEYGFDMDDTSPGWEIFTFDDDAPQVAHKAISAFKRNKRARRKVFLSYSRIDSTFADEIYERLRGRYAVWYDRSRLRGGVDWEAVIEDSLNGSEKIVLLLSDAAVKRRGFFQVELRMLQNLRRFFPEGYPYIVPVRRDECSLPRFVRSIHALDTWTLGDSLFEQICCAIETDTDNDE